MVVAVARIPARTGFHLSRPSCDVQLSLENGARSMTKLPHMILFGTFFLLTVIQFDRVDRMTDVLPDLFGAIVVMALIIVVVMIRGRLGDTRATPVRR